MTRYQHCQHSSKGRNGGRELPLMMNEKTFADDELESWSRMVQITITTRRCGSWWMAEAVLMEVVVRIGLRQKWDGSRVLHRRQVGC